MLDSLLGNSSAKNAAKTAQYRPTDINVPGFGGIDVEFRKKGPQNINFSLDPTQQMLGQLGNNLSAQSIQALLQGQYGGGGNYGIGAPFDQAILGGMAAPGASTAFINPDIISQLFGQGFGMLNSDYRDIASRETDLLRQQARPYEDLATTRALDRLMSRGQLGISTPLRDTMMGLNDHFGQQDLAFQLAGLQRADALRNADRGLGLGLIGQGGDIGLNMQGQLQAGLLGGAQTANQTASTASNIKNNDIMQLLAMLGGGSGVNQQNFQNLMALLTGSTAASSARSGANANAGQLAAMNNPGGTLMDIAGAAVGGWAAGKSR